MKKTNMNNTTMNASGKRNIKVRIIAIALSTAAAFSAIGILAGCSAGTAKVQAKAVAVGTNENNGITGGYTDTASPVLTDRDKALFQKAAESLTGVEYTPVAYLGTQVVAGTNHLFLCKTAPITPGAVPAYALVTVYEDLNGNVSVAEVTAEAREALEKACKGLDGAKYEAKALLSTQVVSGTNYTLLCKITPTTPGAASYYAVVTVYENAAGSAGISETFDFS